MVAKNFMLPYFPKNALVNYRGWKMPANRFKQQNKIKQFEIQKIFFSSPIRELSREGIKVCVKLRAKQDTENDQSE